MLSPTFAARQSGAVRSGELPIPGATVTAAQGEKKIATTTDESGQYVFNDLPAGLWTLRVEMFGFAAAQRDVTVEDKPSNLDWTLELRSFSQTTPVSGAKPASADPERRRTARTERSQSAAAHPETREPSRNGRARAARSGSGRSGQNGEEQNQRGFQNLNLNDTAESQAMAALEGQFRPDAGSPEGGAGAAESFLVNGSLSTGLDAPGQRGSFDYYRRDEFGRGFGEGFGRPGRPGGPAGERGFGGGPGGDGGGPPQFGGGPPGGGPPGGGPGGRFGGGGFGGRGGFDSDRARGGPRGRGPGGASFGNRRFSGRGNRINGSLTFTLRNSALDARPYSLTGQTVAKPSYANNRFGLTLGGPLNIPKLIHYDKIFFFFNYFGGRSRNAYSGFGTVPTA